MVLPRWQLVCGLVAQLHRIFSAPSLLQRVPGRTSLLLPRASRTLATPIGATALWDQWDASPPTSEIVGAPSVFSPLQLLQLVTILRCALRKAYRASRDFLAEFKGEGKELGKTWVERYRETGKGQRKKTNGIHPTGGPLQLFSRDCAYGYTTGRSCIAAEVSVNRSTLAFWLRTNWRALWRRHVELRAHTSTEQWPSTDDSDSAFDLPGRRSAPVEMAAGMRFPTGNGNLMGMGIKLQIGNEKK